MGQHLFFYKPAALAVYGAKKSIGQLVLAKYLIRKVGYGRRFFLLLDNYSHVFHLFSKSYRRLRRIGLLQTGHSLILRQFVYKKNKFNFFQFTSLGEVAPTVSIGANLQSLRNGQTLKHFFLKRSYFRTWRFGVHGVLGRFLQRRLRVALRGSFKSVKQALLVGRARPAGLGLGHKCLKTNIRRGWARMPVFKRRRLFNKFFKLQFFIK